MTIFSKMIKSLVKQQQVKNVKPKRKKVGNTLTEGNGGNTMQDRGAIQVPSSWSLNPYFNNNYYYRWQALTLLYFTSWEARKIVQIPVQDAFRIKPKLVGVNEDERVILLNACDKYDLFNKMRRGAIQERLLGGSAILIGVAEEQDDPSVPLNIDNVDKDDLKFLNVISLNQMQKPEYCTDPFSENYDKPEYYSINGTRTHVSRMIVFDGEPLFNYSTQRLMQSFRINPQGFGESVLVPLWDSINRCIGTQQAGYQLISKASITLVKAEQLLNLEGTKMGEIAVKQLQEMAEMISIYRAAIIKGKGVEVEESGASFGSVPELLMSYLQILSAASDIPASRFLGQAPGGLNTTGDGDLENYYNAIASYQETRLDPKYEKLFDILGRSVLGKEKWLSIRPKFEIEFEPLWNLKETEKAQVDSTVVSMLRGLKNDGIIPAEKVVDEINSKKIFLTEFSTDEISDMTDFNYNNLGEAGEEADKAIGELKNVGDNPKQEAKTL